MNGVPGLKENSVSLPACGLKRCDPYQVQGTRILICRPDTSGTGLSGSQLAGKLAIPLVKSARQFLLIRWTLVTDRPDNLF